MQHKIESQKEYESSIKDEPIELLKSIKEQALNYQQHKYKMFTIFDSLKTVINLKQKDDESLQDYTKRFKTAKELLVSHIGVSYWRTDYIDEIRQDDE